MNRWTYRPELDGLRSVAVYLVVLFHCGLASFAGGYVGVDLFFVLSGFLVSHVIWAEVDRAGSFRLGWFYARRVRRLLPAAVLVIVVTAAIQLLVASEPQRAGMLRDGQAALVYLSNWQFIADARDYFTADGTDTARTCTSGRCRSRSSSTSCCRCCCSCCCACAGTSSSSCSC